jgi:hypothetical protein
MDIDPPPWIKTKRASQTYDDDGVHTKGVKEQCTGAPDYRSLYATYKSDNANGMTVAEQYVSLYLSLTLPVLESA